MLDWRLDREIEDEPSPQRQPLPSRAHSRLRWVPVILVFAVLSGGAILWKNSTEGAALLRADIQRTVDMETWAWQQRDIGVYTAMLDATADPKWLDSQRESLRLIPGWAELPNVALVEDVDMRVAPRTGSGQTVALATIRLTYSANDLPPARQLRFYRRVDGRWLQTAPVLIFWGKERELETKHFRFRFRERDEEAVKFVAGLIDEFYEHIRDEFDVELDVMGKQTVEVIPAPGMMLSPLQPGMLQVSSPWLNIVPVNKSVNTELALQIGSLLGVSYEVNPRLSQQRATRIIVVKRAMILWELRARLQSNKFPAWDTGEARLFKKILATKLPTVRDLFPQYLLGTPSTEQPGIAWTQPNWLLTYFEANALVDHVARRYGEQRFKDVLRALEQSDALEEVIPAALGVSPAEFEQGWRQYLEEFLRR